MTQPDIFRLADIEFILKTAAEGFSSSIVGLSNAGKSSLLRAVCRPSVQAHVLGEQAARFVFVYVDCNLMLTLTPQGFYEVTLRAAQDMLRQNAAPPDLNSRLNALYHKIVEPPSEFIVPLSFNDAIDLLSRELERSIVFLFDEFDEPFAQLDGRVFLNLRALSDRFGERLTYVVATSTPLSHTLSVTEGGRGADSDVGEFVELFVGRQRVLSMLNEDETRRMTASLARLEGANLNDRELDFVVEQAGGHPALIQSATRIVLEAGSGLPAQVDGLALARGRLEDDPIARAECGKLWNQLSEAEREALINLVVDPAISIEPALRASLYAIGILTGDPPRVFSTHFAGFVRRQRRTRQGAQSGVWVDVDAGEVVVDGRRIPTLTDLEYRLLLLLWGRLDKVCDKYQIVENVWGQDYIDEVDDARIEKLVSRLRAKLEQDPANPRYLHTVRGRGYKLAGI